MGVIYVEDPETGEVFPVDTDSKKVKSEFERQVGQNRTSRETLFRKQRLGVRRVYFAF